MRLRTPIILEFREVRVGSGGATKSVWKQWGSRFIFGAITSDKPTLEGDLMTESRQAQERRGSMLKIRFEKDLAARLSGKWRIRFSPMPGMPEEIHLVRGFAFEPESERARFINLKLEREVK